VIGAAASKLSSVTRDSFQGVPWHAIRSLRNRLAHGYFTIAHDQIWEVLVHGVPSLSEQAVKVLELKYPSSMKSCGNANSGMIHRTRNTKAVTAQVSGCRLPAQTQRRYRLLKTSRAASRVRLISAPPWAELMKQASNWDGAK
jgi:hypothetical protein